MLGHSAARDVQVGAPGFLVGEHHAHLVHHSHIFRLGRTHHAGQVVAVGHGDIAFASSHCLDLVRVATFGRARQVGHQALEPGLGLLLAHVLCHGAKKAQVVGVRAGADAQLALVFGVAQLFVGIDVRLLHLDLVVDDHAGAGGKAEPGDAAVSGWLAAQVGGDGVVQHLGLDGLEETVNFTLVQTCGVHQQDHIRGRGSALGLQARQDAGVVGIHAVDLDASGLGEAAVQRFVGGVVAGRVEVDDLFLGMDNACSGGQGTSTQQGFHSLRHGCIFRGCNSANDKANTNYS
ncbi:hypothetical protein D3C71_1277860 [compost metagenome]